MATNHRLAWIWIIFGAAVLPLPVKGAVPLCTGTCVTDQNGVKECSFTFKMDLYAGATGYYVVEECGQTPMPTLALEQNVKYRFIQHDKSNWFHPLGVAYFPDGAHEGVDELEPGISKSTTTPSCTATSTCQAPRYFKNGVFLGTTFDNTATPPAGGADFGLDVYEPLFQGDYVDWQTQKFEMQLTITDVGYTKDLFYFCHVHNKMSGRIKIVGGGASAPPLHPANDPPLGYAYDVPSRFDATCGTYDTAQYNREANVCQGSFFCEGTTTTPATKVFGDCLYAMDCAMHVGMRTNLAIDDPMVTFMHQMIPHHANAVNMAKALMKVGYTDTADKEIEGLLMSIIAVQNKQIHVMEAWLKSNNHPSESTCSDMTGASQGTPSNRATSTFFAALATVTALFLVVRSV